MHPAKESGDAARNGSRVKDAMSKWEEKGKTQIPKQHAHRDLRGLPLHGTLVEALRLSKDIEPPTPIQVAAVNSFLSRETNIFLQAPFAAGKTWGMLCQ
ncbi:uncharacterized protein EAE97_001164 [Botrytis byssoidea]|uniref:Uncharacterized protein n=1 Tax=Botrytis byssoidea TaxID=139641 RepID=A0A9P5IWB0_9HELO|nr:uncharacterized protein EAE97_001164 [Botrytis byssoidea]KAF7953765.1 hypothetical protein EAE97_001164 [Botrytis byssoidea]